MKKTVYVLVGLAAIAAAGYWALLKTEGGQTMLLNAAMTALAGAVPPPAPDGMEVVMCGTASPLGGPDRAQACVQVQTASTLVIVDAGAGSAAVVGANGARMAELEAVLITHLHSDHIADIYELNLASWVGGRPKPLEIIGPEGITDLVDGLNLAYRYDRRFRTAHHGIDLLPPDLGKLVAREVADGDKFEIGDLSVTTVGVDHSPIEPALAFRVDHRGRSVVISGDTVLTDSLVDAATGTDLILHDALSMPIVTALQNAQAEAGNERLAKILHDIQNYHAYVTDMVPLAERTNARVALYHLVPAPRNAVLEEIFRREMPEDAILTSDGMRFLLPPDSDEIEIQTP